MASHEVTFHRNSVTGLHRAVCTCGWVKFGTLDECQSRSATHDMDWQAVDVTAPSTVLGAG